MQKVTIREALGKPPNASKSYKMSNQRKIIPAGERVEIPIFKTREKHAFVLKEFHYSFFNQLSEQDLRVSVFVGNSKSVESGRWDFNPNEDGYPWHAQEIRTEIQSGIPYNISSTTEKAYHENECADFSEVFLFAENSEKVSIEVLNQSQVHDHGIEIRYNGWSFSPNQILKEEN